MKIETIHFNSAIHIYHLFSLCQFEHPNKARHINLFYLKLKRQQSFIFFFNNDQLL